MYSLFGNEPLFVCGVTTINRLANFRVAALQKSLAFVELFHKSNLNLGNLQNVATAHRPRKVI